MSQRRRARAAELRRLLETEGATVARNTRSKNRRADAAIEGLGERYEELRTSARAIKEEAIAELPELIETVKEAVEENGGTVYVAEDAADANAHVAALMERHGAERLVKSKSMTTEELDLNEHLEAAGYDVFETDLGEFVVQVAEESPSHLIGPALHKSPEEIAALFNDRLDPGEPLSADPEELTAFAREYVGRAIREADVGLTGANFIAAESGTVALVTNEGNARKTAVTPPTHVAVAGVEKLVPSIADLQPFVELIARTGTGQELTSYVSLLTPPTESPTLDFETPDEPLTPESSEDRSFHLVLVDNGRMAMREDPDLRETLYCIRCGACANACSNFQVVGGHGFGGETYTGGIATGWEAGVHGLESAGFNDLCTGCTRCVNKCPVKIDIPWINTVVRDRINREEAGRYGGFDALVEGLTPDEEPGGLDRQKRLFGNVATLVRAGSVLAPVSNWVASTGPARVAMEWAFGVDRRRSLPTFERETFRDWLADRADSENAARTVVLYPDVYTNYVDPDRGRAAVRTLEALGVRVRAPALPESGRAPLSQGMVATARERAREVADGLADHLAAGRDVVVLEPSDLAMFRRDYERLLPATEAAELRERTYGVCEYVHGLVANGADLDALAAGDGESLVHHGHCQARTLGVSAHATALLETRGFDVEETTVECCGMAGSFGYKTEYYEVAMAAGEELKDSVEAAGGRPVAAGTSCADQLAALVGERPPHPIEVLAPGP